MTTRLPHAFLLSGSLHAAAVVALVWLGWSVARPEAQRERSAGDGLVMVPAPSTASPATSGTTASSPKSTVTFTAPKIPASALRPIPTAPVAEAPTPVTPAVSVTKPAANLIKPNGTKMVVVKPATVAATPTVARHSTPASTAAAASTQDRPRIDVTALVDGLQAPSEPAGATDSTMGPRMEGYFAALKDRALAAYVRPAGVPEGLG